MKQKLLIISIFLTLISEVAFAVWFSYKNDTAEHSLIFTMKWLEHDSDEFRTKIIPPNSEQGLIITNDRRWKSRAGNARIQIAVYVMPDGGVPYPACDGHYIYNKSASALYISNAHVVVGDYLCSRSIGYTLMNNNRLEHVQTSLYR